LVIVSKEWRRRKRKRAGVVCFAFPTYGGAARVSIKTSFSGNLVEKKPFQLNITFSEVNVSGNGPQ
jgi:hypothetical protein